MDLTISGGNNFYKLKGNLNKKSISVFQNEFKRIFETVNSLVLSLEDLSSIDRHGVKELKKLHNESVAKKKALSIVGSGKHDLLEKLQ